MRKLIQKLLFILVQIALFPVGIAAYIISLLTLLISIGTEYIHSGAQLLFGYIDNIYKN